MAYKEKDIRPYVKLIVEEERIIFPTDLLPSVAKPVKSIILFVR